MINYIIDGLKAHYWLEVIALDPLSDEADNQTYKVLSNDHKTYFLKLNRNPFNTEIFNLLAGIKEVVLPVKTLEGKLTQQLGEFNIILYPFIAGQNGISRALSDDQWTRLGQVLKKIHQIEIPSNFQIRHEDFSPRWHEVVRSLFNKQGDIPFLTFLHKNRILIEHIVERAEALCEIAKSQKQVLCHSDFHGGNVLLEGDSLYLVDWDNPIMAPKERELIFVEEGDSKVWNKPVEKKLFYQGYGPIDQRVLSYYRFERIVQDIAVFAHAILSDSQNKVLMYRQFLDMFAENGVIKIAFTNDPVYH